VSDVELKYYVRFKATGPNGQQALDAQFALRERLLNIEGTAIDTTVNANKWQVPSEDLAFLVQTLQGAQLRIDHTESALAVVGRVPEAKMQPDGNSVWFRAEIGDLPIIERVLRGYLDHVSIQIDSDDVQCSKCLQQTRKEGLLVHLCPDAYEIVHKPKVRELSIVASPAYKNTAFKPVGFAAAMNESQKPCEHPNPKVAEDAMNPCETCGLKGSFVCTCSQLSQGNKDGGSKGDLQEPDNEGKIATEAKTLPEQQNAQAKPSPHSAQGVVNVNNGQGESAPTQVNYTDFMQQLESLQNQIATAEGAEAEAMRAEVARLQKAVQNRATKQQLSKKISDLQQQLQQGQSAEAEADADSDGDDDDDDDGTNQNLVDTSNGVSCKKGSKKASGKGLVQSPNPADNQPGMMGETTMSVFGNIDWFSDVAKATAKLRGMK